MSRQCALVVGLAASLLLACGDTTQTLDENVVATFQGGTITSEDIDTTLIGRGESQTRSFGVEDLEKLVRRLAARRILLVEAKQLGLDREPEQLAQYEELRREAIVAIYLERHPQADGPPTEEELQAYYDEHEGQRRRNARRVVYHLFKRYPDEGTSSRQQIRDEVAALRQRVEQGEPFQALAAAYSDSESRHYEGLLGIVGKGQLPPQLDEVVFALEEGVPSEPLATREGVHLFWVESAVPEATFGLDELHGRIGAAIQAEKNQALIVDLVRRWQGEVPVVMPDEEQLRRALAGGSPEEIILAVGDYRLSTGRFRRLFRRAAQSVQQPVAGGLPQALLESVRRREIICQHLLREDLADTHEAVRRASARADNELAAHYLEQLLDDLLDEQPEQIEAFYERNKMRFATPLRLQLRRLRIPLGPDANRTMAMLEAERSALDRGEQTLETLVGRLGGEIDDLGWQDLAGLQRIEPKAVVLVAQLTAGQHSPPYRTEDGLELVQLVTRQEPQVRPLAEVEQQVRRQLLLSRSQQLYDELEERLLASAGLRIFPDRLLRIVDLVFVDIGRKPADTADANDP